MKSIKQIRESYDLITEKEETENRKLATLVRAGLYDAKKLPALKKALDKSADKMTSQERRMLINLLDSLINQVIGNDQIYRRVKQNVQQMNEAKGDYLSKYDPRFQKGYPSDKKMPTVLILKRKAIRVYPDNQKVALYYSQALDKYVTIPFNDIQTGINEEDLNEGLGLAVRAVAAAPSVIRSVGSALRGSAGQILNKGKDLGKKTLDSFKKSRADKAKNTRDVARRKEVRDLARQRRGSGPRNRGGRGGRGGRNRDRDFNLDLGNSSGNTPAAPDPALDTSKRTYAFDKKPSTVNAWDKRVGADQTQQRKMQQANLKAMQTNESVFDTLKTMVNENIQHQTIKFDEQEININNTVAKKIMHVYESVNVTNKKKMEKMLNESSSSFNKVLTFAIRQ
jgi:hypothetical protein